MDELGVGALVHQPRDLERQRAAGGGVGRRVGQRERHALVVHDPRAALLALQRPRRRLLQQPPHRADAARRDPDPLLGEPRALQRVAVADAADHGVVADLDVGEADRRMPVRIGVRERRVVDHLDARRTRGRRGTASARRSVVRDDDVDGRDVAVGDEPLLAVDDPAAVAAHGGRRDARGV